MIQFLRDFNKILRNQSLFTTVVVAFHFQNASHIFFFFSFYFQVVKTQQRRSSEWYSGVHEWSWYASTIIRHLKPYILCSYIHNGIRFFLWYSKFFYSDCKTSNDLLFLYFSILCFVSLIFLFPITHKSKSYILFLLSPVNVVLIFTLLSLDCKSFILTVTSFRSRMQRRKLKPWYHRSMISNLQNEGGDTET